MNTVYTCRLGRFYWLPSARGSKTNVDRRPATIAMRLLADWEKRKQLFGQKSIKTQPETVLHKLDRSSGQKNVHRTLKVKQKVTRYSD